MKPIRCALTFVTLTSIACAPATRAPEPPKSAPSNGDAPASSDTTAAAPSGGDEDDGACEAVACIALCEKKGRPRDCDQAGNVLRDGNGTKDDPAKAARMFEKGCEAKDRNACFSLAEMLERADKPDDAKAVAAHTKACDLGRGQACDVLSKRHEAGRGVPKDHAKAIALLGKGCAALDYQVWTCTALRDAVDKNDKDAVKVVDGWKIACAGSDKTACQAYGRLAAKK
jgi:TPR repeat protein